MKERVLFTSDVRHCAIGKWEQNNCLKRDLKSKDAVDPVFPALVVSFSSLIQVPTEADLLEREQQDACFDESPELYELWYRAEAVEHFLLSSWMVSECIFRSQRIRLDAIVTNMPLTNGPDIW